MAKSIFDLDEFKPYAARWQTRQAELATRRAYFDGSVYAGTRAALGFLGARVTRSIRPLYLPLSRAVFLDAGIVPAHWTLAQSAAPLESAVKQVLTWSDWLTDGMLYVRYGAEFGSVGLKVSDLRDARRVIISPISPETFMLVASGAYDKTPALALVVESRTDDEGKPFEYAEVISAADVRTYANGEPRGFGGRKAVYPNSLGFVPLVEVPHLAGGGALGECTFQNVIPLLDGVNELASDLAATLKQYRDPQYYVTGVDDGDLRRGDNVWYLPDAAGKAGVLAAPIDVGGILAFIKEVADNLHGGLPELAFDDLRSKQQVATATVALQLMELTVKIGLVRPNYDHGLVHALRLAGRAASSMVDGDERSPLYDAARLDSDELAFDSERETIPLDPESRATLRKLIAEATLAESKIVSSSRT